jgi:hypothetical protein
MGQCCSKNADPEPVLVTPHQMPQTNSVCTPILNGVGQTTQIKLQSTSNFYHPQNSSFQSQSHLNSSATSDSRRKDAHFGEETVIALFPYESRSEGDLSFQ